MKEKHLFEIELSRSESPFGIIPPSIRYMSPMYPMVFINTGLGCNHDCRYCLLDGHNMHLEPTETILSSIKYAAKTYPHITLSFIGGEPLVHPDIDYILLEAGKYKNCSISLSTNGTLLDSRERVEWLVGKAGVKYFVVSFDSHIPERLNWFSQRDFSFDKVTIALDNLLRFQEAETMLSTIVCKANIDELPQTMDYVHDLELKFGRRILVIFSALKLRGFAKMHSDDLLMRESEVAAGLLRVLKHIREFDMLPVCMHVTPCLMGSDAPLLIGMYNRREKGVEINGRLVVRESRPEDTILAPKCSQCRYRSSCTGIYKEYLEMFGDGEFKPIT